MSRTSRQELNQLSLSKADQAEDIDALANEKKPDPDPSDPSKEHLRRRRRRRR